MAGDALLDLIVAEELYKRFPRDDEGSLSLRKQLIVRNDVLSIASQRLELTTLLLHSRERIATLDAERQRSMAERSKLDRTVNTEKRNGPNKWQADVFEALVCALYLANTDRTAQQSGFEAAARLSRPSCWTPPWCAARQAAHLRSGWLSGGSRRCRR